MLSRLRSLLALSQVFLLVSTSAYGATWVVDPSGGGAFTTIQPAVTAASDGDIVELVDATYKGLGNRDIDYQGKMITVRSQSGDPTQCIIDCEASENDRHRGFVLRQVAAGPAALEGVTITNGFAPPEVQGITTGGALYSMGASITITNCVFIDNEAAAGGALLFVSAGQNPDIDVIHCVFLSNRAEGVSNAGGGGAIHCSETSPTITECVFEGNRATHPSTGAGGAIFCSTDANPSVVGCTFANNYAEARGGGFFCASSPTIHASTFDRNSSGGAGGSIAVHFGLPQISNTIIAFSLAGEAVFCDQGGGASLTCCDVYGNSGGNWTGCIAAQGGTNGNFSADPLFCDPDNGEFTIRSNSPCAPPGATGCELVGALPVACGPVSIDALSWGKVKGAYR